MMQVVNERKVILASTSPRRRELLQRAGLTFSVEAPGVDEDMSQRVSPQQLVKNLALYKADAVAARHPDAIVIAADTVVAFGNARWSKPVSNKEARMMLRALSGRSHDVWTGFAILDPKRGKKIIRAIKTRLTIRKLSSGEIERYIATGEPLDGAGGYKMQGMGGFILQRIVGDYNNVLGLPLGAVLLELKKLGIRA